MLGRKLALFARCLQARWRRCGCRSLAPLVSANKANLHMCRQHFYKIRDMCELRLRFFFSSSSLQHSSYFKLPCNVYFAVVKQTDMEQSQDVHLEEVFWRSPQHVQMMGGFLHSNNSRMSNLVVAHIFS